MAAGSGRIAAAGLGVVALVLAGGGAVAGAAAVTGAATTATPLTTTVLAGDVLGGLTGLTGAPVAASTPMQVGVILSDPNASGLNAAYQGLYSPGSSSYHHFLTTTQVNQEFGLPAASADPISSWATRDGLTSAFQSPDNEYVLLSGTAAQVEQTFNVQINQYDDGGTLFYANSAGPTVPTGVSSVIGLNNLLKSHTFNQAPASTAPHGTAAPAPANAVNQDTCVGPECLGLTTPQDLWSTYDMPTDLTNTNADFGQGQSMAVLGEGEVKNVVSDLRIFENEFGLPEIPVTVHSVGDTFTDTSGDGEWDIDTQASTGMAPKAAGETLYFADNLYDPAVLGDVSAWSGDATGPLQANASFGECEQDPTSPVLEPDGMNDGTGPGSQILAGPAGAAFTQQVNQELEQATLAGKTLFASTGDTGSSCPVVSVDVNGVGNEAFPETNFPASSPYAVAVGGTVLYTTANTAAAPASNAERAQETSWTFTGGGNTFYVPRPAYQSGITLLSTPCLAQPDGTPYAAPTPCRGIPDVAAQSGDVATNGYAVTMAGTTNSAGGGTSLSSPLWVGMWTRVQAAAGSAGLGFANPSLYQVGTNPAQAASAFFDIGAGVNTLPDGNTAQSPPTANGYYTSAPGWDYTSGLGSPNVIPLAQDLLPGNTSLTPPDNVAPTCTPSATTYCGSTSSGSGASGSGGSTTACSGSAPVWTNPPHSAKDIAGNEDAQLNLSSESLAYDAATSDLQITLKVADMSQNLPNGATGIAWYAIFGSGGTQYFADAEAGPGGVTDFADGTLSGSSYQAANTDTGSFVNGSDGSVTIDVPLAHIAANPGSLLTDPAADSYTEAGVPPNPATGSTGLLEKVDTGGPGCSWVVAGAPSASASTISASPTSVPADGTTASTVTVVVKDANGDALPGQAVTLSPGGGSSTISPTGPVTTDSSGAATFSVTDSTPEAVTYTATVGGNPLGSATVTFTRTTGKKKAH
jgi:pseudomonalisin